MNKLNGYFYVGPNGEQEQEPKGMSVWFVVMAVAFSVAVTAFISYLAGP